MLFAGIIATVERNQHRIGWPTDGTYGGKSNGSSLVHTIFKDTHDLRIVRLFHDHYFDLILTYLAGAGDRYLCKSPTIRGIEWHGDLLVKLGTLAGRHEVDNSLNRCFALSRTFSVTWIPCKRLDISTCEALPVLPRDQ